MREHGRPELEHDRRNHGRSRFECHPRPPPSDFELRSYPASQRDHNVPKVSSASTRLSVMESRYFVSLKETDEGYSVWVPGLPGCWSQGADEYEALSNIRDAVREYLSAAQEFVS